jgi:glyoxylase-like metal-dependent hydrolase (beta-lactamase superfamily II)
MHRFALGDITCTVLNVGQFPMDASVLFANAPAAELDDALARHQLGDTLDFMLSPLLVDTGQDLVLIDPSAGTEHNQPEIDRLVDSLRDAGAEPAGIDAVVLTHCHPDHYTGCADAEGQPLFPNARYYVQQAEWDQWQDPANPEEDFAAVFRQLLLPLRDRFILLDGEESIVPGVDAISTPGHSRGHMSLSIGGQLVVLGDALIHPVTIEHPDWVGEFERLPDLVIQSRRKLLRRLADERLWAIGYHFPLPGTGRVTAARDGWQWHPQPIE